MNSDNYKREQPLLEPYANLSKSKSNEMQKSHKDKQKKWIYYIEDRRREVTQMLA